MQTAAPSRLIVLLVVSAAGVLPAALAWAQAATASPASAAAPVPVAASPPAPPAAPDRVASAFAIELSTGGLSAPQGGAIGLGWGSTAAAVGVAFDLRHSSLTGPDQGSSTPELTETAIAVGLWLRFNMLATADGRLGLFGAVDGQYARQSTAAKGDTDPNRAEATATGFIFRVGPGLRYWVTPRLAVGYTGQLQMSTLSGPLLAFTQSTTLAPSDYQFTQTHVDLVGRFTVLALF